MLALSRTEIERLLPMPACIARMADALAARARGETVQPLRQIVRLPDGRGLMGSMPAWLGRPEALAIKVITVFPGNAARGWDSHQGAVLVLDPVSGKLDAVLEAGAVTAIRTAAVSAVATDRLARADADDLALLGAGVQAWTHLEAVASVRKLRRIRIWNRTPARATQLAARARERWALSVEVAPSAREAVQGASLICTVSSAKEPILEGAWVSAGVHLNLVGSSTPAAREVDTTMIAMATVFVDARESALNEAGDLLIPIKEGAFTGDRIAAELGEVLAGQHPGRKRPEEITLFKSLGLGIEDAAAAELVVKEARRVGAGQEVTLDR